MGPGLVGAKVKNVAKPEWGVGTVLRSERTRVGGRPAQRLSIQFAVGHRTLLVPPARLVAAAPEPQREAGWLAKLGKHTLDDQLRALPAHLVQTLGSPRQRLTAIIPLYEVGEEPRSLQRWACSQTGVSDPLSHWTRDELLAALRDFCARRDAHLRAVAARLEQADGPQALHEALAPIPERIRLAVLTALRRAT